jgi:NTE family protein
MEKQKVSLVLSGGGARGIAHIGVIEELEKQGFEIFSISGTSIGALVGGVYALGKMDALKKWIVTLDKLKIFGLVDFTFRAQGFIKGDKLFNTMKEFIPDANIEDLKIHYTAVAADIINKKEVVFTRGSIYDAIRASIAIPTLFTPVKTETGLLVDGGVINNIPMNHAKRIPNDILIAVNVNADVPVLKTTYSKKEKAKKQSIYQKEIKNFYAQLRKNVPLSQNESLSYFELINKTITLMSYHITQTSLKNYKPDILIKVSSDSCSLFDFYKAEEMIEIGRLATLESLKTYKTNVPEFSKIV